jgi:hypothetical protein
MNNPRYRQIFALSLLLCLFTTVSFAQQIYGSIYGTVTDPSGAPVVGAQVTITDAAKGTKFEVVTNSDGNYTRERLIPGIYHLEVEMAGFSKAINKSLQVNVDASNRVDVKLQVGTVSEQIEVTSEAPLLQADRADVSTTFSSKQLVDLPRLDRNFQSYLLLSPGTTRLGWNHASSENPQGSVQIMVNGQHFAGTGYTLDGTDNQDPILGIIVINPTVDSATEVKIASQNYDAEFSYVGSGIMNTSTKSGSNAIHGSMFDYIRANSPGFQTSARDPFSENSGGPTPPIVQNQFGGSIGGALIRNKLFYFGDAQLLRKRTGATLKTTVPTALARTGDLSEYVAGDAQNAFYDPLSGNATTGLGRSIFPGNKIPAARLSPQAAAILKYFPSANYVDTGLSAAVRPYSNNFLAAGSEAFDSNQWDSRWDYFINEKSSMFGRYSYAGFDKTSPAAFGTLAGGPALNGINFGGGSNVVNQSLAIGYTRTLSASTVADIRFGYMRYRVNVSPGGLGTSPAKDAGIPGLNLDTTFTSGMPGFFIDGNGGAQLGYALGVNQCNCPLAQREQQYQFVANVTKTVGNHNLKFGGDVRRALNLRVPSDSHRAGELRFDPSYTGLVTDSNGTTKQGLGMATFLLGQVTGGGRYVSSVTDASESQPRLFWYGQDTWRITSKLQMNYGLRWEMVFPERTAAGNGGQLDLSTGNIAVFGVGQVSNHGLQQMNWANFAPRVGVTYQLAPKTVVRAGYGWSYSVGTFGTLFGHNVTQNLPVLANQTFNRANAFSSVFSLSQGPATLAVPKADSNGVFRLPDNVSGKARAQDVRMPRVEQFNFSVQHQLFRDLSVTAAYVGNVGRHVFNGDGPNFNINQAAFVPGIADSNLRKPYFAKYGWTQGIDYYCDCATNRYNSFQLTAEKRFSKGLTFNFNYTYQVAKGDDGDSFTFIYNRPLGWGNRDNIPHNQFVWSPSYELPFGRGRKYGSNVNKAVDYALGGWTISGITTYYSGRPFTPSVGNIPASAIRPNSGPADRPDTGSKDPFAGAAGDRTGFYIGCAGGIVGCGTFGLPGNNAFGNIGIRSLFGPRFINQDMSLAKNFKASEKYNFSLRAESFNAANHTNLGDPNNNVTSPDAGKITGLAPSYSMRKMQFALRLDF